MKRLKLISLLLVLLVISVSVNAQFFRKKRKKIKDKNKTEIRKSDKYTSFLKKCKSEKGLFTLHLKKEKKGTKLYFEIPTNVFEKPLLFGSKVSETSDESRVVAGQMQFNPILVYFKKKGDKIYLHQIVTRNIVDQSQTISKSFQRNNITPIYKAFDIKYKSKKDSSFVVDVTNFMKSTSGKLGMPKGSMFSMRKKASLKPLSKINSIEQIQSFPKNINVKCKLNYVAKETPFSAIVTRSFILLPEKPMMPRFHDPRLSYFRTSKYQYDENKDKGEKIAYINRWNIQPKKEDLEKYKAGEIVEPEKPIVFYVDDALPEKWKKYIKEGIEDWQPAFEAIGFKNAIIAKDFPKDDPNFNPEDIRYSCFRYITTPIANAMGPSWVDPRSGEIIQGSVYLYHNVLKLLHNWRFVQTAAVDPRVRKKVFDEEVMGEALRYVAAHEIGHTLGLMHNFASSYAYPVDSLRSATFTQKYGTTPSIMDYARNNYVAQPQDKGVRLTPPLLGVYDIHSIKLGYKPIFNINKSEEEYETINKWILEKSNDPMYLFGPQTMFPLDPASQSEAIGDDAIKASKYGVKNAKVIMKNLLKWTKEENKSYKETYELYNELLKQYNRYFTHVMTYIGGSYLYMPVEGQNKPSYKPVSKKKQREALKFIFNEFKSQPKWINNKEILSKFGPSQDKIVILQKKVLSSLMGTGFLNRIITSNLNNPKGYTIDQYLNDLYNYVWTKTMKGQNLNKYERSLEYVYVYKLFNNLNIGKSKKKSISRYGFDKNDLPENSPSFNCVDNQNLMGGTNDKFVMQESKVSYFNQLNKIKRLLEIKKNTGNSKTKNHYQYLLFEIKKALK